MLVRVRELLKRINGFSTPLLGVSWTPPVSDREAVRGLMTFLEDRRALFNPLALEVESHVNGSVHSIRGECVKVVSALGENAPGAVHVRAIGAACRRFLDDPYPEFEDILSRRRDPHFGDRGRGIVHMRDPLDAEAFFTALGEFRAFVGTQIALLAALYELDVHGDLVRILPPQLD